MTTSASELTSLYRQIVLDHSRQPRNQRRPHHYDREAEGHNPLCGDKVRIYLQLKDDTLQDISFEASGCAICLASASLMTENTTGLAVSDVRTRVENFEQALSGDGPSLRGDLAALGGVSEYPSRIRCATLPWKTLRAALDSCPNTVTTE